MDQPSSQCTAVRLRVTNKEKTEASNHKAGEGCRCSECERLKELEDKWICRLGTFHGQFGLNERDEMKRKNRVGYWEAGGQNRGWKKQTGAWEGALGLEVEAKNVWFSWQTSSNFWLWIQPTFPPLGMSSIILKYECKTNKVVIWHLLRLIGPHQLTTDAEGREGWPSENSQPMKSVREIPSICFAFMQPFFERIAFLDSRFF